MNSVIIAVAALMAVAPSARAEQITDARRACIQRVLENPGADSNDVQACLSADKAGPGDPDKAKKALAPDSLEAQTLFAALEARFSQETPFRPSVVKFADVKKALVARPDLLYSLGQMEKTGGAPDVIAVEGNVFVFADVSAESPEGRRNLNYDEAKKMADEMGVEMMSPDMYRKLQEKIPLDRNTWSRLLTTDPKILKSGDALYGSRCGGGVCVFGDRAEDCYSIGGWRAVLRVPK